MRDGEYTLVFDNYLSRNW